MAPAGVTPTWIVIRARGREIERHQSVQARPAGALTLSPKEPTPLRAVAGADSVVFPARYCYVTASAPHIVEAVLGHVVGARLLRPPSTETWRHCSRWRLSCDQHGNREGEMANRLSTILGRLSTILAWVGVIIIAVGVIGNYSKSNNQPTTIATEPLHGYHEGDIKQIVGTLWRLSSPYGGEADRQSVKGPRSLSEY